jgi:hypothetical protein
VPDPELTDLQLTDPEVTTELPQEDLAEVEVDAADEFSRPTPLEAEEADVVEQRSDVPVDDDDIDPDV